MQNLSSTNDESQFKSKTQVKKDMLRLTELGHELAQLRPDELAQIPLNDELRDAIEQSHTIKQHSARKRHFQFIGKLIRKSDGEAIVNAHRQLINAHTTAVRHLHAVEQWRDQLLSGDKTALSSFLQTYPHADRQQIRQLIKLASQDVEAARAKAGAKKLFKLLRDTMLQPQEEGET